MIKRIPSIHKSTRFLIPTGTVIVEPQCTLYLKIADEGRIKRGHKFINIVSSPRSHDSGTPFTLDWRQSRREASYILP